MRGACKDSKLGMTKRSNNFDLILIPLISHLEPDYSSRHKLPDKECWFLCWIEWVHLNHNQAKIDSSLISESTFLNLNFVTLSFKLENTGTTMISPDGKRGAQKSQISWQLPKLRNKHFCLERKLGRLRTIVMSAPKVVKNVSIVWYLFLQAWNLIQLNFLWQPAMNLRLLAILVNTLLYYLFWPKFDIIWRGYLILTKH